MSIEIQVAYISQKLLTILTIGTNSKLCELIKIHVEIVFWYSCRNTWYGLIFLNKWYYSKFSHHFEYGEILRKSSIKTKHDDGSYLPFSKPSELIGFGIEPFSLFDCIATKIDHLSRES